MKIYIGPYKNWIGPFQICDAIFFWQEEYPEDALEERFDYKLKNKLQYYLKDTWVNTACEKIDKLRKRKIKVQIHDYDSWSVDATLAPIILPLLKQLKATKHGAPNTDLEDVPEYMRTVCTYEYDLQMTFDFYNEQKEEDFPYNIWTRYEYILDEMIFAFEQLQPDCDYESQYWITRPEMDMNKYPEEEGKIAVPIRWKVPGECQWKELEAHEARISNGLRLFGKYFRTLWN